MAGTCCSDGHGADQTKNVLCAMNTPPSKASKEQTTEVVDRAHLRKLVRKARKGEEAAFEELVRMYHSRVYGVVYRVVNNANDADDLVQQTWLKVWKKLGTFQERSEFFTWVYRIATFVSLDFIRKRQRQRESAMPEGVEPEPAVGANVVGGNAPRPDRAAEHTEIGERFEKALDTLSPEHRMALVLREVEGLSYQEIAQAMKCRKGTVMSRIYYARKNVQDYMRDLQ